MDDIFENAKKIKAFKKLFLAIGNKKFIIKDLEKPDEHHTILFTDDGMVDIHKTVEGSDKKYESLGKFDMLKTVKEIVAKPEIMSNALEELVKGLKEVNFDESEFSHLSVGIMPSKEELSKLATRKKNKVEIPLEAAKEFDFRRLVIPWNKAKNKVKDSSVVYDKDNPVGFIFTIQGKSFYMSVDAFNNSAISKLMHRMTHPEKSDS